MQKPASAQPKEVNPAPILIVLMVFAAAFSIFFMRVQSLGLDEAQSLWQAAHSFPGILYVVAQDVHVPLYHFILHLWLIAFGNSVPAARMLSLVFYLPTIPLVYVLGCVAFGKRSVGLWAAAFFALSPFTNWYGSVIRMYSLLALVTVVNQIFFLLIYKGDAKRRALYWTGYFISGFFGIYTHYFFLFNLAAEALFYFGYRKLFPKGSLRNFIIVAAVLLLLFSPWLLYVRSLGGLGMNTTPKLLPPTTVDVFNTFSNFLFGFQTDIVNAIILSLWPLLTLLLFFGLQKNKRVPPEMVFAITAALAPIIAAALLSYVISPFYLSRYFIGVFPAFCLAASWVISIYPKSTSAVIKGVVVVAMLVALGVQTTNAASPIKEDYQDASNYLNQNVTARDVVAVSTPFTIYPIEYYYQAAAPLTTIPAWDRSKSGPIPAFTSSTVPEIDASYGTYERLWLVASYDQGYQSEIVGDLDASFQLVAITHFSPGLDIYEYRLRDDDATMSSTLSLAQSFLVANASSSQKVSLKNAAIARR